LIQRAIVADAAACLNGEWPEIDYPTKPPQDFLAPQKVDLEISGFFAVTLP
jgi:hypothetical protein